MKIVVLEGSPNRNGSSNLLASEYLNLTDMGRVLGSGCGTPDITKQSKFPKLAYELGKSLL